MVTVCGTVEVLPAFQESNVSIVSCRTSPEQIVEGEGPVETTVNVQNENDRGGTVTVRYTAGGNLATIEETFSVRANGSAENTVEFMFEEPGTYEITVEILSASA